MPLTIAATGTSRTGAGATVAAALTFLLVGEAAGQLRPERTYYGINRPIPMSVSVPGDATGPASILLLEPETAKVAAKAPVQIAAGSGGGGVDLAALFPMLWNPGAGAPQSAGQTPPVPPAPRLYYAQLAVGDRKIGPAVVLQPMVTPAYASRLDQFGEPVFQSATNYDRNYSGLRAYVDKVVALDTSKGPITIALRPDVAPNTVWNFRQLVEGGFYTNVLVHRVVAMDARGNPFVIQTGDPLGTGTGGPGFQIDLEPSTLPHDFGVISMARTGRDANTAGSQFFVCLSRDGTAALDKGYASFGQCIAGAETIQAIAAVPIGPPTNTTRDRPADPPVVKSATLVDAAPYGEGPRPVTAMGTGPIRK